MFFGFQNSTNRANAGTYLYLTLALSVYLLLKMACKEAICQYIQSIHSCCCCCNERRVEVLVERSIYADGTCNIVDLNFTNILRAVCCAQVDLQWYFGCKSCMEVIERKVKMLGVNSRCQFHQHYTHAFFLRKCFSLDTFWQKKHFRTKITREKRWWNWHLVFMRYY